MKLDDSLNLLKEKLRFLFPFFVVLLGYEMLIRLGILSADLFPSLLMIGETFSEMLSEGVIFDQAYLSLHRMLLGYILGAVLGVGIGIAIGAKKVLSDAFKPVLSLLISVPTIAWVPILLVITGLGNTTIILAIFLGSFFPVVYNSIDGARSVEKTWLDAAEITGANKKKRFLHVMLPGSLKSIIPGLRLAIGYSWRALVGAEMLASRSGGLGRMIYGARSYGGTSEMLVGLAIIGLLAYSFDSLLMKKLEENTVEKWGMVKER